MKFSYNWMKKRLGLEISAHELGDLLTSMGIEVEHIDGFADPIENVVVAQVQKVAPHPGADRLHVAQVFDGEQTFQVVCGASNCREGIKVALARIGAKLPGGFEIKKAKLRGVDSFGMLCSLDEIGYSGIFEGIYEFDQTASLGSLAIDLINEPIFVLSLTPDLGHALSLEGICKLVAARLDIPYERPKVKAQLPQKPLSKTVHIAHEACLQYLGVEIEGLQVGPSPKWLRDELEKAGYRSVNNIVDVGNWVCLELGRPVHFFDMDKLEGFVEVRASRKGEKLHRIDGVTSELDEGLLVIADAKGPVALAGVMGSEIHAISENSRRALLEVALFDPKAVRALAKAVACHSESSRRFERGVCLDNAQEVACRILDLLKEICEARSLGLTCEGQISFKKREILFCESKVKRLLGIELSQQECLHYFKRLGFAAQVRGLKIHVEVSLDRHDVAIEEDLVDEIMKIMGTDKLPRPVCRAQLPDTPSDPIYLFNKKVREQLRGFGLNEVITPDFVSSAKLKLAGFPLERTVQCLNPVGAEADILRPTLLSSMLAVVQANELVGQENLAIFEIGNTYTKDEKGRVQESQTLGILIKGLSKPFSWSVKERPFDFYDLKGLVENLFEVLGAQAPMIERAHKTEDIPASAAHPLMHSKREAICRISLASSGSSFVVGSLGQLKPSYCDLLSLKGEIYYTELSLEGLLQAETKKVGFRHLPLYPSSSRDWTLTVPISLPFAQIKSAIACQGNLESVELVSLWKDEKLGDDRQNLTLRLHYRSDERTLTQQEIEAQHLEIQQKVLHELRV